MGDGNRIQPGSRVGDVVVRREAGRGAFGVVWLGHDEQLGRDVALKVLPPATGPGPAAQVERFLAEARVVARLAGPHVVTLYRLHELSGGRVALEMEYVAGGTLGDRLRAGGLLPADEALRILRGVVEGLGTAHGRGVLHRDLKPANVLLTGDGLAKLTDFGLARILGDESERLRESGELVGTPSYMAPEVLLGKSASVASDLWGVGVLAYRMAEGRLPFSGDDLTSFFFAMQNVEPPPVSPGVDPRLARCIARCLVKEPAERAASCDELRAILHGPAGPVVAAPRAPERPRRFFGRRRELARVRDLLARLRAGGPVALTVHGEPGIGKSALLAEARRAAEAAGCTWLTVRLSPFEGPLKLLVDASVAHAESSGTAPGRLREVAERARDGSVPTDPASPDHAVSLLTRHFRDLAAEAPLCLCVEETWHATREDLLLLRELARRMGDVRFLPVFEERAPRGTAAAFAELPGLEHLAPGGLSDEALYAFLEHVGDTRELAPEIVRGIARRSDGNPVVAAEMLRHLRERGVPLDAAPGGGLRGVPDRLRELVAARVADLSEEHRALLELAAVDGVRFDGEALAASLGQPVLDVLRTLQTLCRSRTLIEASEEGYRFTSALVQEVLYEELSPELRKLLHRQLAEHLADRPGGAEPARMIRHWEGCGEPERARPHLIEAARTCARRHERARLIELCTRAGLLEETDPERLVAHADLLLALAPALVKQGRRPEARRLFDGLRDGAEARGDRDLARRIALSRAHEEIVASSGADVDAGELHDLLAEFGDTPQGGQARQLLGTLAKRRGEIAEARDHFEQAQRIFRANGPEWQLAATLDQLGSLALRSGRHEEAEERYGESAELAARHGRVVNAVSAQVNRVSAALGRGQLDGHEFVLERAVHQFKLRGAMAQAAHVKLNLAQLRYALGDVDGARETVAQALAHLRRTRHAAALCAALRLQASLLVDRGSLDAARPLLEESSELARKVEDHGQLASTLAVQAHFHSVAGEPDRARDAAREAIALVRETLYEVGDFLMILTEAVVHGLPVELLEGRALEQQVAAHHRTVLAGFRAWANADGDPKELHAAADVLETGPIGPRRAVMRVHAPLLRAEALRREGRCVEAARQARRGIDAASSLGLVWLQAALDRAVESVG